MRQPALPHKPGGHDRVHAVTIEVEFGAPLSGSAGTENTVLCYSLFPPGFSQYSVQVFALRTLVFALGLMVGHGNDEPCWRPTVPIGPVLDWTSK